MTDEFIDFYQELELEMDADVKEVRKRMSEVYLEAQRNLEHRDSKTRARYQELFEVVLPRARYVLVNEERRAEYDHVVRVFRGIEAPPLLAAPDEKSFGEGDASRFRLADDTGAVAGRAPRVEALPVSPLDSAQMAAQRDEMLAKWKMGLEAAIARDEDAPKPATAPPRPPVAAPVTVTQTAPVEVAAPRPQRPPATAISFNFGAPSSASEGNEEGQRITAFEIERQNTERKRAVMQEILSGTGFRGALIGGFSAAVPLGALLIFVMGRYYPRAAPPQTSVPSALAWFVGLSIITFATVMAGHELSKALRRQASIELSTLPLEELLRKIGRSY